MEDCLSVVSIGTHQRLAKILEQALGSFPYVTINEDQLSNVDLRDRRVLFAVSVDHFGMAEGIEKLMRRLRHDLHALDGSIGAVLIDGDTELYTKELARLLVFDADRAGCCFPSRSLVEATKWLRNYDVLCHVNGVDRMTAYINAASDLVRRLAAYSPQRVKRPDILLLHASNRSSSNTLALGLETVKRLSSDCDITEIALHSGNVFDCNGCSYRACSHFAGNHTCYYGGIVPEMVFPAIEKCDAVLLCCPNYNDAPGAFFLALNNRLNALMLREKQRERALFSIVVSGYSGGDIVARQLLGGFSLNKFFGLPPRFCMLETANDPGTVLKDEGIQERLDEFSLNILKTIKE